MGEWEKALVSEEAATDPGDEVYADALGVAMVCQRELGKALAVLEAKLDIAAKLEDEIVAAKEMFDRMTGVTEMALEAALRLRPGIRLGDIKPRSIRALEAYMRGEELPEELPEDL